MSSSFTSFTKLSLGLRYHRMHAAYTTKISSSSANMSYGHARHWTQTWLCLHCILSNREVLLLLPLLQRLDGQLMLKRVAGQSHILIYEHSTHFWQSPSDCPRFLWSQVKRLILLVFVVFTQVLAGLLVHDCQYPSNRLANSSTNPVLKQDCLPYICVRTFSWVSTPSLLRFSAPAA